MEEEKAGDFQGGQEGESLFTSSLQVGGMSFADPFGRSIQPSTSSSRRPTLITADVLANLVAGNRRVAVHSVRVFSAVNEDRGAVKKVLYSDEKTKSCFFVALLRPELMISFHIFFAVTSSSYYSCYSSSYHRHHAKETSVGRASRRSSRVLVSEAIYYSSSSTLVVPTQASFLR